MADCECLWPDSRPDRYPFGYTARAVQKLTTLDRDEPSPIICQWVEAARAIQQARFVPLRKPNILVNGDMGPSEVQKFYRLDKEELVMICMAVERMGLACESIINVMSKVSPSTF